MKCYTRSWARSCEHDNEPSGSIKGREFLDWLSGYWLLKKDSTPQRWLVGWLVGCSRTNLSSRDFVQM